MIHSHAIPLALVLAFTAAACSRETEPTTTPSELAPTLTPAAREAPSTPPASQRPGCSANFDAFDDDEDGRLSREEFLARPHARGAPATVFDSRDADGDGFLSRSEFCANWQSPPRVGPQPGFGRPAEGAGRGMRRRGSGLGAGMRCAEHFQQFDADSNGKLTLDEFSRWPHMAGEPRVIFQARDKDGDGVVTQAEFCAAWSIPPR